MTLLTSADQVEILARSDRLDNFLPTINRRALARLDCLLPVQLADNNEIVTIGTVQNISLIGAMIRADDAKFVPDEFNIVGLIDDKSLFVRVMWRKEKLVGVKRIFHNHFSEKAGLYSRNST